MFQGGEGLLQRSWMSSILILSTMIEREVPAYLVEWLNKRFVNAKQRFDPSNRLSIIKPPTEISHQQRRCMRRISKSGR